MNDGPSEGQRNKGIVMLLAKVVVTFGCARHKLITYYAHTGTVRDRAARQASRYDRENEAVLLRQRFWTATVSARRYGLSANTSP